MKTLPNLEIHPNDEMFSAMHGVGSTADFAKKYLFAEYYRKGYELAKYVERTARKIDVNLETCKILEVPSGYGRVTRHLSTFCPEIRCADIDANMGTFLENFGASFTLLRPDDYELKAITGHYDVVIMGSLVTHFNEEISKLLVKSALSKLRNQGIFIFTFHGERSYELISENDVYEVGLDGNAALISSYEAGKYGFVTYSPNHNMEKYTASIAPDWGISITHPEFWHDALRNHQLLDYQKGYWDDNQDIIAIRKNPSQ